MNKSKIVLAAVGGVIGVAALATAFLAWRSWSAVSEARDGGDSGEGLDSVVAKAATLSRKAVYPCAASVKAIDANRERFEEWRDEAARLAAPLADRETTTFRPSGRLARCLFCGKERAVDARGYCRDCVRERLDAVHEMTGRTNGWDRTARRAAVAADEWRGRPVAGPKRLLRDGIPQLA